MSGYLHSWRAAVRVAAVVAVCLAGAVASRAMTVIPPSFTNLVEESGSVVRGRVVAVESFRGTSPAGRPYIATRVTWEIAAALKGSPGDRVTLQFLGGSAGGARLTVPGMPQFAVGDEDYLFIERDTRVICPLVGAGHGRIGIRRDPESGAEYLVRANGTPLLSTAQVQQPLDEAHTAAAVASPGRPLTPAALEAAVRATLGQLEEARRAR